MGRGKATSPAEGRRGAAHGFDARILKQSAKSSTASVLDALAERLVRKAMEKRLTRTASSRPNSWLLGLDRRAYTSRSEPKTMMRRRNERSDGGDVLVASRA